MRYQDRTVIEARCPSLLPSIVPLRGVGRARQARRNRRPGGPSLPKIARLDLMSVNDHRVTARRTNQISNIKHQTSDRWPILRIYAGESNRFATPRKLQRPCKWWLRQRRAKLCRNQTDIEILYGKVF